MRERYASEGVIVVHRPEQSCRGERPEANGTVEGSGDDEIKLEVCGKISNGGERCTEDSEDSER